MANDFIGHYIQKVNEATSTKSLWEIGVTYFRARGVKMIGYIHLPLPGAPANSEPRMVYDGFPKDWAHRYYHEGLYKIDPITQASKQRIDPYRWSDISELIELSNDHKIFIQEFRKAGLGDGIAIPVFGPGGRNGLVSLGFGNCNEADLDLAARKETQWACQATHVKYCEFVMNRQVQKTQLSPREREVLTWVARGKSNGDISTIMTLSPNTVDTYMRRIYAKLDVADRVTAAVQGVGSGIITP